MHTLSVVLNQILFNLPPRLALTVAEGQSSLCAKIAKYRLKCSSWYVKTRTQIVYGLGSSFKSPRAGLAHFCIQLDSRTCRAEGRSSGLNDNIDLKSVRKACSYPSSISAIPASFRGSWIVSSSRSWSSRRGPPSTLRSVSSKLSWRFTQLSHHSLGR